MILTSCTVDLERRRIGRDGRCTELTAREADLLRYFGQHPSRIISRDELLTEVWGYADSVLSRASDNVVRRLREKVERDPRNPDHILTVFGVGYRFEPSRVSDRVDKPIAPERAWLALGSKQVDLPGRQIMDPRTGRSLALTEAEHGLLARLLFADGAVVDRRALERATWGPGRRSERALDGVIARLRKKLEVDPNHPTLLITARGGGYRLTPPQPLPEVLADDPLIGRGPLLAELAEATSRWVLLLGPAGIGKSRLARAAAPDALWVGLSDATDPRSAAAAAARALGIDLGGADPVLRVGDLLARRGGMVILDELERLGPPGATLVTHWLAAAPTVRFLGTSRVRLGVDGERVIEVPPLDPQAARDLFVERARAASSANRYGPAERDQVSAIVERLDGNPLAVELAAARTAVLGLSDLATRLSVNLLGGLPRLIDDTLRGLPTAAQAALEQLARFREGFTIDDAEAVIGADALDLVQLLRDHSLLHRLRVDHEGRLVLSTWALVREILLGGSPDLEQLRRHCRWLGRWGVPPLAHRLAWVGEDAATDQLVAQVGEVTLAARDALQADEPELAGICAAGALWVYASSGPYRAGTALAEEVLAGMRPGRTRALVQLRAGEIQNAQGDFEAAQRHYEAGLQCARAADDPVLHGALASRLAGVSWRLGQRDRGRSLCEESIGLARRTGLADGSLEYRQAAVARYRGDGEGEEALLRRAWVASRESGNRPLQFHTQLFLAIAARNDGRFGEARRGFEALLDLAERAGQRAMTSAALRHLLNTVVAQGDVQATRQWSAVALQRAQELTNPAEACFALFCRACAATLAEDPPAALRDLDEAEAVLGAAAYFQELAGEVAELRCHVALQQGQVEEATRLARRAIAAHVASGYEESVSLARCELAMALLAAGDVAGARRELDAASQPARALLAGRLCQEAVVAIAEGRPAATWLARARAEVSRNERVIGDGDASLVRALVGAWAAERSFPRG